MTDVFQDATSEKSEPTWQWRVGDHPKDTVITGNAEFWGTQYVRQFKETVELLGIAKGLYARLKQHRLYLFVTSAIAGGEFVWILMH